MDLGSAEACRKIATRYRKGGYLGQNEQKETYCLKLAAKRGDTDARFHLGICEFTKGNVEVAVKHFMICAAAGHDDSLKVVRDAYRDKAVSKEQFEKAIRANHKAKKEMSSDEWDMAKKVKDAGMDLSVLSNAEKDSLYGIRKGGTMTQKQI